MSKSGRLRVLIFAQYFPPDIGGSATRAYNVAKGLTLNGCDVVVVAAFPHYPSGNIPLKYRWKPAVIEGQDGFKIIRTFILPLKSEGFLKRLLLMGSFTVSALFAAPLYWNSDIVWGSSWMPSIFFSKIKNIKAALNVDDLTLEDITDLKLMNEKSIILKIGHIIYGFFYKLGDAITPISPGYIGVLAEKYDIPFEKIHFIRAGVDTSIFSIKNNKINDDRFKVLYSGSLSIAYDFDQVLSAAKLLKKLGSDVEIIIQGGGEEAEKIKRISKTDKLSNVKFLNNVVSRAEVADLLNEADVLLLPLRSFGKPYLGISTKLYEYQAMGKPIICSSDGVPKSYLDETQSGIAIMPGDYKALTKSIIYLKEHRDVSKKMGDNGRNYITKNITINIIGEKFKELFVVMLNLKS